MCNTLFEDRINLTLFIILRLFSVNALGIGNILCYFVGTAIGSVAPHSLSENLNFMLDYNDLSLKIKSWLSYDKSIAINYNNV